MSLKEQRDIVALARAGMEGVLVTLVRAEGSTYRRPGARLLVLSDGRTAGTISGGCLEADLLRKAHWRVRNEGIVQRYDTSFDEDDVPFGLGCGGIVDLLLEDVLATEAQAMLRAMEASLRGERQRIATQLPREGTGLQRAIFNGSGGTEFASECLTEAQVDDLRGAAFARDETPRGDLFVEELLPAQRLIVFGAGEDTRPLVSLAAELGWTLIVVDRRPQYAREERFPEAQAVFTAALAAEVGVRAEDAVVLMTHSFERDHDLLAELLPMRPRYLGLLGARHRSALLLHQASVAAGLTLSQSLERVHAPIGLELGGDGPESIALATIAEIQLVLHGGDKGKPLARRRMSLRSAEQSLLQYSSNALAEPPAYSRCSLGEEQVSVGKP